MPFSAQERRLRQMSSLERMASSKSFSSVSAFSDIAFAGLGSIVRSEILGRSVDPVETGDLAYRVTITKERVEELNDPSLSAFLGERALQIWVGPDKHAVLYPIRNMQQFNLVLM